MGPDAMIFVFWMLSFKPTFSLSSFTFIKRPFSSSSLSAIRVGSSAYLRLLIFLPAILIPAYASSSPAFLMMYSAYKLNKQGDNIQPWCTPFPCPVLTVASWPAYRFLKRQVRWSGIPISFTKKWICIIHTMEYFQPLKRFGNLIHATPWNHYGKWSKLDTKEQILCDCTYMRYLVSVRMKSPGYQVPEGDYWGVTGELIRSYCLVGMAGFFLTWWRSSDYG